jgi:hypothetical protein
MSLTITARQRDALYDQILDRLSGIGDVWLAARARNYDVAERLSQSYCDDLRLLTDDLGWGKGHRGTFELSTPPDVLRRWLSRLCETAESYEASQREEWAEAREAEHRNRLIVETCRQMLAALDAPR